MGSRENIYNETADEVLCEGELVSRKSWMTNGTLVLIEERNKLRKIR